MVPMWVDLLSDAVAFALFFVYPEGEEENFSLLTVGVSPEIVWQPLLFKRYPLILK